MNVYLVMVRKYPHSRPEVWTTTRCWSDAVSSVCDTISTLAGDHSEYFIHRVNALKNRNCATVRFSDICDVLESYNGKFGNVKWRIDLVWTTLPIDDQETIAKIQVENTANAAGARDDSDRPKSDKIER